MTGPRIAAQQRVGASALSGALVVGGGAAAVSAESMWSGARIIGHRVVGAAAARAASRRLRGRSGRWATGFRRCSYSWPAAG